MDKIKVMLSSTVADMQADRDAIVKLFERYPFVEVIGANPVQQSSSASPLTNTLSMAETCDFYILLLGQRYGYEIAIGVSATEAEFDRAYKTDPTKILVFKNTGVAPHEAKQAEFIQKVGDYHKGFWISDYKYTHDLQEIVENSFLTLLKERASIGKKLTYIDHFVRLCTQRLPAADAVCLYAVTDDLVELKYKLHGTVHVVQFQRSEILKDFWGCIANLEKQFHSW